LPFEAHTIVEKIFELGIFPVQRSQVYVL